MCGLFGLCSAAGAVIRGKTTGGTRATESDCRPIGRIDHAETRRHCYRPDDRRRRVDRVRRVRPGRYAVADEGAGDPRAAAAGAADAAEGGDAGVRWDARATVIRAEAGITGEAM